MAARTILQCLLLLYLPACYHKVCSIANSNQDCFNFKGFGILPCYRSWGNSGSILRHYKTSFKDDKILTLSIRSGYFTYRQVPRISTIYLTSTIHLKKQIRTKRGQSDEEPAPCPSKL